MKTLTEFSSVSLKNAIKIHGEVMASGKTEEELPAALGEALRAEGDKLTRLLAAIEIAKKGKLEQIKRILVMSANEGETTAPPAGAEKREELYYVTEFFPGGLQKPAHDPRDEDPRARRGDKRGGRGDKDKRRSRAPGGGPSAGAGSGPGAGAQSVAGERPARAPRAPKAPHPPRDPSLPPPRIIPRSEMEAKAANAPVTQESPAAATPASGESPQS